MALDQLTPLLRRDVAHIKDDMRRTIGRTWNNGAEGGEQTDPLVDLLIGAMAEELFGIQQQVEEYRRSTVESAVQAMLPDELATPRPAHAILHARPVDLGTWTHRVRTAFSTDQRMDVHDRTGTTFTFTPAGEFRLYNGAVRHVAHGDKLTAIDARTGQARVIAGAIDRPLAHNVIWIALELDESIVPAIGLPLFFYLPTADPAATDLAAVLAECSFTLGGMPLQAARGLKERDKAEPGIADVIDPVRTWEEEARRYYRSQFITLRADQGTEGFKMDAQVPENFTAVFGREVTAAMDGNLRWLRMELPGTVDPRMAARMGCSMNCFPVLERKLYERTSSSAHIVPLTFAEGQQFWAVESVVDGNGEAITNERNVSGLGRRASYGLRMGGMERIDAREASLRLADLLHTVRQDHAAFAALDETDLARGLGQVRDWLEDHRARRTTARHPRAYLQLRGTRHRNTHVHYWATTGSAAARVPALKTCRLDSGAYLADARTVTAAVGGSDTPERGTLRDRLRATLSVQGEGLPTVFTVRALCMNALPANVRDQVVLDVERDVVPGQGKDQGFQRVLAVRITADEERTMSATHWRGTCQHLAQVLNRRFQHLLPVTVEYRPA